MAALGGIATIIGAAVAEPIGRRLGVGHAMVFGLAGLTVGAVLLPLAPSGAILVGTAFLVGEQLIGDACVTVFDVSNRSLTQSIVDDRILGRVNATIDFVTTIVALVAAIGGGIIAEVVGLRAAMAVGVAGCVVAVLLVWFSPVRTMRSIPDHALPDPT